MLRSITAPAPVAAESSSAATAAPVQLAPTPAFERELQPEPETFEQVYPRHEFAPLVRLALTVAEAIKRACRGRGRSHPYKAKPGRHRLT